jgi:hypothetical protein
MKVKILRMFVSGSKGPLSPGMIVDVSKELGESWVSVMVAEAVPEVKPEIKVEEKKIVKEKAVRVPVAEKAVK